MRMVLHPVLGRVHQGDAMRSLALGVAKQGIEVLPARPQDWGQDTDIDVWWGNPRDDAARNLILEAGYINGNSGNYIRDRLRFVSVSWDRMHGRSTWNLEAPADRWEALGIRMKPWRMNDGYVLICDQVPGDSAAPDAPDWWSSVAERFEPDREVIYRPHPIATGLQLAPLKTALEGARFCFTWSSTAAIEAVIEGVPTWALDPGSMARPVCAHSEDDGAHLIKREQWAYNLAYRQWTLTELESGEAWETIWLAGCDIE